LERKISKIIYLSSVTHPLKYLAYIIQSITFTAPSQHHGDFTKDCIYTCMRGTFNSTAGLLHTDKLQAIWSATNNSSWHFPLLLHKNDISKIIYLPSTSPL
jgi:hypothetical protein